MPIKEWPKEPKKRKKKKEKPKKQKEPSKIKRKTKSSPLGTHEAPKKKSSVSAFDTPTKEGFYHGWCYCDGWKSKKNHAERTPKECKCGWSKKHVHCKKCGRTVSVG